MGAPRLTDMQWGALAYLNQTGRASLRLGGYNPRTWWSLHRHGLARVEANTVHRTPKGAAALAARKEPR